MGRLGTLGLSLFVMGINGCEGLSWNEASMASEVKSHGELRVLTLRHPLVDTEASALSAPRGMERDLLQSFASTYSLQIRWIPKRNVDELYEGLRQGEGDMAAGRLWTSDTGGENFRSGPAFEDTHLSLFCRRSLKIANIRDLSHRRVGLAGKDNFNAMDTRLREFVGDVDLRLQPHSSGASLIEQVARQDLDCAIVENMEGLYFAQTWPVIEKVTSLSESHSLSWLVQGQRKDLMNLLQTWFQRASREDEIMRLQDQYQSRLAQLSRHDARLFLRDLRDRLPKFRRAFRDSAQERELDWRWVAAVAYQESHWNPAARSFTGVRGLMQLTQETADHVGIEDREDPLQSIWGGTFYLRSLMDRLPASLDPQEKMLLTLAAYNCGIAHLRDAQTLAARRGLNPWSWRHLKIVLPLLEKASIADSLPAGAARGRETVQFVERVRAFHGLWKTQ